MVVGYTLAIGVASASTSLDASCAVATNVVDAMFAAQLEYKSWALGVEVQLR
jgi:hypothetical protein